jgi:hypothetical protein
MFASLYGNMGQDVWTKWRDDHPPSVVNPFRQYRETIPDYMNRSMWGRYTRAFKKEKNLLQAYLSFPFLVHQLGDRDNKEMAEKRCKTPLRLAEEERLNGAREWPNKNEITAFLVGLDVNEPKDGAVTSPRGRAARGTIDRKALISDIEGLRRSPSPPPSVCVIDQWVDDNRKRFAIRCRRKFSRAEMPHGHAFSAAGYRFLLDREIRDDAFLQRLIIELVENGMGELAAWNRDECESAERFCRSMRECAICNSSLFCTEGQERELHKIVQGMLTRRNGPVWKTLVAVFNRVWEKAKARLPSVELGLICEYWAEEMGMDPSRSFVEQSFRCLFSAYCMSRFRDTCRRRGVKRDQWPVAGAELALFMMYSVEKAPGMWIDAGEERLRWDIGFWMDLGQQPGSFWMGMINDVARKSMGQEVERDGGLKSWFLNKV